MAFNEKYVTVTGGGLHDGSSEANAWTLAEANLNASAGDRVNVKAGNYSFTTSGEILGVAGTASSPVWWRGYKASIGDMDIQPTSQRVSGTDIPLFTSNATQPFRIYHPYNWWSNIHYRATTGATSYLINVDLGLGGTAYENRWIRCRFEHQVNATNAYAIYGYGSALSIYQSSIEVQSSASMAISTVSQSDLLIESTSIKGGATAWDVPFRRLLANNCLFLNQSNYGINIYYSTAEITNSTFYNSGSDCIRITNGDNNRQSRILNCAFNTAGGFAINNLDTSRSAVPLVCGNMFFDSSFSSGRLNNIDSDIDSISESADFFTDAASEDFSVISSSGGYGRHVLFQDTGSSSYRDAGAIQHQDPSGGGGATVHPLYAN
jgi:hypothetical protein